MRHHIDEVGPQHRLRVQRDEQAEDLTQAVRAQPRADTLPVRLRGMSPTSHGRARLMALQQAAGNRAVAQLMRVDSDAVSVQRCGPGGCADCGTKQDKKAPTAAQGVERQEEQEFPCQGAVQRAVADSARPPIVQRVATFSAGPVHQVNNLADAMVGGGVVGFTPPVLNGTQVLSTAQTGRGCGCRKSDARGGSDARDADELAMKSEAVVQRQAAVASQASSFSRSQFGAVSAAMFLSDHAGATRVRPWQLPHTPPQGQTGVAANFALRVQREPDKKRPDRVVPKEKQDRRRDVVLIGQHWAGAEEWAWLFAPRALKLSVTSSKDAATQLANRGPIGTLYVVAHSKPPGMVKFSDDEGYISHSLLISTLRSPLSEGNGPMAIDFRGCNIGQTPRVMEEFASSFIVKQVTASNCFVAISKVSFKIGGRSIATRSDVTDWAAFDKALRDSVKKPHNPCVVNLSRKGYFAAGGALIRVWLSPDPTGGKFDPDTSVCYKDAQTMDVAVDSKGRASVGKTCHLLRLEHHNVAVVLKEQGITVGK